MTKEKQKQSLGQRLKLALNLFLSYFKIGLFTFGGGYAMIALIDKEFVQKKKWINEVELYEIIAIAESTPGPIAINCATFVGNKVLGFWGSFLSTLAVCIPSFAIIYLISVFYDTFMSLTVIANAFNGIQVGIALMITTAGINMLKNGKKNAFSMTIFAIVFVVACLIDIFNINFSTIYLILLGGLVGIIAQAIKDAIAKKNNKNGNTSNNVNSDIQKSESQETNGIDIHKNDNNATDACDEDSTIVSQNASDCCDNKDNIRENDAVANELSANNDIECIASQKEDNV